MFGDGPLELLERVAAQGSLRRAAAEMNMSYSQAWSLLKSLESRLGFALLERRVGGREGGGSVPTDKAKELMERYRRYRRRADRALLAIFNEEFQQE